MRLNKPISLLAGIALAAFCKVDGFAQCDVTANSTYSEITCGECVTLSHAGSSIGNISFEEDFNTQPLTGWSFTQQATFTNPCSPNGVDGTDHLWMGAQSAAPRSLETLPLNFGPAVAPAGGTICFDMLFAEQGDNSPCEGPDEPQEGVYLQYSLNGGTTWITINYFDPNGGYDPQLINWNNWCFAIPNGALVNGVQFRWFQDADSGAEYDHWGIDNVQILVNDPSVQYVWQHDNYTTNLPGNNPTQVCPLVTTTYTVNMTTSTGNCTDNVQIVVVNPVVVVNAGLDQQVCAGECVDLAGTASVINNPGGITTFSNNQTEDFDASVFGGGSVNVNVQDLNMSTVNPGSLVQVCISSLEFSGFGLPPGGVEALSITLVCPDGTQVVLVPIGGAPAGAGGLFGTPSSYQNACFVPSGGSALLSASPNPITGTFNSSQPFSGMNGCTANGVWSIAVATNALSGNGTFDGWSITFDDEVDEYTPDVLWSPTTYMAAGEQTTLTPNVCPNAAITYTLTASDDAGCVTVTDAVSIAIDPNCCDPQTPPIQGPTPLCENATGNVYSVTNTVGSTYAWTVPAGATITAGQGTNSITVSFGTNGGQVSVIETITCGPGPAETFAVVVQPCAGCTMNSLDMAMTDCYTSGQGFLQYDIEGTLTFTNPPTTGQLIVADCFLNQQVFLPPFLSPMTITFTGLPQDGLACDFGAVFSDDQNCNITTTFTAPPTITNTTASCVSGTGVVDGTIEFNAPPTTGTIVVSIFDGVGTQTTNIQPPFSSPETWQVTGLDPAAATYVITYYFSDFPTCEQTQTIQCGCSAEGGTTTTTVTGDGTIDFILCDGDQLDIVDNGDYTLPDDEGILGGIYPYQPAYTFLVYGCPPTPGIFPGDDPCFAGIVPSDGSMMDINDPNSIFSLFPPGLLPNNQLYYVPITLYHYDPITPNYIINANCWDLGAVTTVSYLPPVVTVVTPDCQTNTVSVMVEGGYPEVFGGNFTASNLLPATASFVNTTTPNLGNIVIENLQNGDNYSFDITDQNGCPTTITGGPFVALPIAAAGTDAQTCILSYDLEGVASYGTGTWTGGPAGTTFAPDANTATATVTVPTAGVYTFTWTEDNGNGCVASDEVVVTFSLMSIPAVITDAACGASDGEIVVAPQGGVGPYTYAWTSGGNTALEPNLGPGNVTVTVTDATGCSLDSTFAITQPVTFTTVINTTDELCFAACDGEITIQPDGVGPYNYAWTPNVSNTNTGSNLCQGNYQILVSDVDGCTLVINRTVGGPTEVIAVVNSDVNQICIGGQAVLSANVVGGSAPYSYLWTANPADPSLIPNASNPTVSPTVTTSYTLIATDAIGCPSAPKVIVINVLPPLTLDVIRPLVSPDTSICPYDFATIDLQAGGGDGNYQIYLLPDITNPITLPLDTQPLVTTTFDFMVIDGCTTPPAFASSTITVHLLPLIIIDAEPDSGCHPLTVNFTDLTQPPSIGWSWNFGDSDSQSNTAGVSDPVHLYSGTGLYDVSLSITTAEGCITDTVLTDFIEVFPLPNANFDLNPEVVNLIDATINFTNLSTSNAIQWDWNFDDGHTSTLQNPTHVYSDTGTYTINLLVTTIHGCTDEVSRQLIIEPDFMFYVPNAFTPNDNGRNDGFRGYGEGVDWSTYQMSIFDRWGELIYYTKNIDEPWDGTFKGAPVELAVYVWKIELVDVKGNDHDYYGHVTLLR
ncbi:MAG: gliding motility-associated C-terminal domain-containing protein [Flavobacteriales bacterium]|nr:gliding motility-associated C-terminal domain-containing protein [Flavobacteriales bacterium]